MPLFYSFLWLSNIPLWYMYHIFFIYSSVDGHLGCFHVLAIVYSQQWTWLFESWFSLRTCLLNPSVHTKPKTMKLYTRLVVFFLLPDGNMFIPVLQLMWSLNFSYCPWLGEEYGLIWFTSSVSINQGGWSLCLAWTPRKRWPSHSKELNKNLLFWD